MQIDGIDIVVHKEFAGQFAFGAQRGIERFITKGGTADAQHDHGVKDGVQSGDEIRDVADVLLRQAVKAQNVGLAVGNDLFMRLLAGKVPVLHLGGGNGGGQGRVVQKVVIFKAQHGGSSDLIVGFKGLVD